MLIIKWILHKGSEKETFNCVSKAETQRQMDLHVRVIREVWKPALQHGGIHHCLQCRHPIRAPPLPGWFPAHQPGGPSEDGLSAWALYTQVWKLEDAPESWPRPGQALAMVAIWTVSQQMEGLSLFLYWRRLTVRNNNLKSLYSSPCKKKKKTLVNSNYG